MQRTAWLRASLQVVEAFATGWSPLSGKKLIWYVANFRNLFCQFGLTWNQEGRGGGTWFQFVGRYPCLKVSLPGCRICPSKLFPILEKIHEKPLIRNCTLRSPKTWKSAYVAVIHVTYLSGRVPNVCWKIIAGTINFTPITYKLITCKDDWCRFERFCRTPIHCPPPPSNDPTGHKDIARQSFKW